MQSEEIAGFHLRKLAAVTGASFSMLLQESPALATCQRMQLAGWPLWVGPGGVTPPVGGLAVLVAPVGLIVGVAVTAALEDLST